MFQKSNSQDPDVILKDLDVSQQYAITTTSDKVVIRASAGSGKTKTLIAAVADYRYENVNDHICAITYTRAARAEMEGRLQELGIYDVEVTTIHVGARNILMDFAAKYGFEVKILQEKEIKYILSDIIKEYLIRSKVRSVNLNILYSYITGGKNMDITDNYRRTLNALEARYIAYKRNNGLYDFSDYPQYLGDVMETYDEVIKGIDALFVDEFQDVDEVQFNIFEKVVGTKKKFFIGDPGQSIYIFRNADGEVFNKLDDFEPIKLKYNYRSYQEIIDYAAFVYQTYDSLIKNEDGEYYITKLITLPPHCGIQCARGYGGQLRIINPGGKCIGIQNSCIQEDLNGEEEIKKMLNSPTCMVLCRTNKQVRAIQDAGYFNASTVHQAKGLEYDEVIVIDTTIDSTEDLNVAYVAMTRAKNKLLVVNGPQLESIL